MTGNNPSETPELVALAEAERLCCERLGMSPEQFRHELAEHVRGNGGIAWIATETAVGMCRAALDQLLCGSGRLLDEERSNDR